MFFGGKSQLGVCENGFGKKSHNFWVIMFTEWQKNSMLAYQVLYVSRTNQITELEHRCTNQSIVPQANHFTELEWRKMLLRKQLNIDTHQKWNLERIVSSSIEWNGLRPSWELRRHYLSGLRKFFYRSEIKTRFVYRPFSHYLTSVS